VGPIKVTCQQRFTGVVIEQAELQAARAAVDRQNTHAFSDMLGSTPRHHYAKQWQHHSSIIEQAINQENIRGARQLIWEDVAEQVPFVVPARCL
jgi:hypothetical protein